MEAEAWRQSVEAEAWRHNRGVIVFDSLQARRFCCGKVSFCGWRVSFTRETSTLGKEETH